MRPAGGWLALGALVLLLSTAAAQSDQAAVECDKAAAPGAAGGVKANVLSDTSVQVGGASGPRWPLIRDS
jgi:hypothetical protein